MEQEAPQAVPVAPVDAGQAMDQLQGAAAATGQGLGVAAHDLSVYGLFMQADWIVKAVMIMLLLASIWSWAIIIHKLIRLRALRAQAKQFEDAFWSGGSLEELFDRISNRPTDPMASIFVAAMREWRRSAAKGLLGNEALARHGRVLPDFPICVYTTVRLENDAPRAEALTHAFLERYYGGGVNYRGLMGLGPAAAVIDTLKRYEAAGVTDLCVRFAGTDQLEQVEQFAREVLPAFAAG